MVKNHKASALLLAFFMMTMLILVSISVAVLVLHDTVTVRAITAGAQSAYTAEGMMELGLLGTEENLPGFEAELAGYAAESSVLGGLDLVARDSEGDLTLPCDGQGDFRALKVGESIQIPLFYQTDVSGNVEEIGGFYTEFYVGDKDGVPLIPVPTFDVLRWKILGLAEGTKTEALSEYIPLAAGRNTAEMPTLFGTDLPVAGLDGYTSGKFLKSGKVLGGFDAKFSVYPIDQFLADHSHNYLVITNVVTGDSDAIIYVKFHGTGVAVCEYSELASQGDSQIENVRQEIVTLVREGENFPVFDFVLYHTLSNEEEESGVPVFGEAVKIDIPFSVLGR
ncbi:MAG: hypothetical protein WC846_00255 [Candidatus Gracilibacteria bacterium]